VKKGKRRLGTLGLLALLAALVTLMSLALGGGPAGAAPPHPLTVTATTSIHCDWSVTKSASSHGSPLTSLTLAVGESFTIDYAVNVTKSCTNNVTGTVSGGGNPSKVEVTAGGTAGVVSGCSYDAVNDMFSCNYVAHPSSSADGTVNAVATYADSSTQSGSTTYSFVGVIPDEPSVDVFDSYAGTLQVHLATSKTFTYSRTVSFSACGNYTVDNTARVVDATELARTTLSIPVSVPCGGGCTLTQGYWKTHSKYGPAPSDPAWNNITPSGPDTTFFLSGQTWYQVFNTSSAGGNAYYILAHQYMAARLNILNGASSTSAVDAALSWSTTFFNTYTPAQIGALKGSSALRATAISNASTLESFNSGAIGPGHCDS
jgi:hypothetical protein